MADAYYETDHAIALALEQRRRSEEDAQAQEFFDESLARLLQDEEIIYRNPGTWQPSLKTIMILIAVQ